MINISGSLPAQVIMEFLMVWDLVQNVQLHPGISDVHCWVPTTSGNYTARSTYKCFLVGSIAFEPEFEKVGHPHDVNSLSGLLPLIGYGRLIDWNEGGLITQRNV